MLNRDVHRYLELQRSLGFKFRIQGLLLKNFVAFAEDRGDRFVQTSRAIEWAGCAPSAPQRYNRLATVRRCALALHAEDTRHEVPPSDVYGRQWFKRKTRGRLDSRGQGSTPPPGSRSHAERQTDAMPSRS
jgi:hypothetical protein